MPCRWMSHYCRPVLTAKECIISLVTECGVENLDNDMQRQLRESVIVDYICRDHVDGTDAAALRRHSTNFFYHLSLLHVIGAKWSLGRRVIGPKCHGRQRLPQLKLVVFCIQWER